MLIGKSVVLSSHVRTNVVASLYISLMRVMYLVGTLCFSKAHHMTYTEYTLAHAEKRMHNVHTNTHTCVDTYTRTHERADTCARAHTQTAPKI